MNQLSFTGSQIGLMTDSLAMNAIMLTRNSNVLGMEKAFLGNSLMAQSHAEAAVQEQLYLQSSANRWFNDLTLYFPLIRKNDKSQPYSYMLYSKSAHESTFQSIPAKDRAKVLNIYPVVDPTVSFMAQSDPYNQRKSHAPACKTDAFIKTGRGVLFGHDTMVDNDGISMPNFFKLAHYCDIQTIPHYTRSFSSSAIFFACSCIFLCLLSVP